MERKLTEKFQIIGANAKMQTTSLEDEIKLIDGVPYNIDFFQDFSAIRLYGRPLVDFSVADIIEFIIKPKSEAIIYTVEDYTDSGEAYRNSQKFTEWFDKHCKTEEKWERKWKKGKKKRAEDRKRLLAEIESGEYFLKDRR